MTKQENIIIEAGNDDFGAVLNRAVRYACGRATYMPDLVCKFITPLLPKLNDYRGTITLSKMGVYRNLKKKGGLDYFPLDVHLDDKLKLTVKKAGVDKKRPRTVVRIP